MVRIQNGMLIFNHNQLPIHPAINSILFHLSFENMYFVMYDVWFRKILQDFLLNDDKRNSIFFVFNAQNMRFENTRIVTQAHDK